MSGWLLVTPARNEADNLPHLAACLREQTRADVIDQWVIVDDGSTDGTATAVDPASMPFPVEILRREPTAGGLRGGGAFRSFIAGATRGLELLPDATRVCKLDADMQLAPDYFEQLLAAPDAALVGGIITSWRDREQMHHVRGALKCYDRAAFEVVRALPIALGLDLVDEVAVRHAGMQVRVVSAAHAVELRRTGSSEGMLEGRRRTGIVARWTGYHPLYFVLRLVRTTFRKPYVIGAGAMALGYLRADPSPYDVTLRRAHRAEQSARLRALVRNPRRFLRATYSLDDRTRS
jgi:glycosyltransferase involved in cell wall biosynthesis